MSRSKCRRQRDSSGSGGKTQFDNLDLSNGFFEVDQLAVGSLTGGGDIVFSHVGVNNGVAKSTVIGNITTPGSAIIEKLFSNDVTIFTDRLGGVLKILDGQLGKGFPGQADLKVNGLHTKVDSVSKVWHPSYDFWFWTLDGSYSLTSSSTKTTFPEDSSMRQLVEYGVHLPHRDLVTYQGGSLHQRNNNRDFFTLIPLGEEGDFSAIRSYDMFTNWPYVHEFRITPLPDKDEEDEEMLNEEAVVHEVSFSPELSILDFYSGLEILIDRTPHLSPPLSPDRPHWEYR